MNQELSGVQAGFTKGRGTRDQIPNIRGIINKAREFRKNIYLCFIDYAKGFDCVDHNKLWQILQEMGMPDHLICSWEICMQVKKQQLELDMGQYTGSKSGKEYISWEICMQVKKQQLELDMGQHTGSKSGKEYIKDVYCHPAYLTYMQNTSWEMPGWMKHKLESRLLGEIPIPSDMQMKPPLWQKVKKN